MFSNVVNFSLRKAADHFLLLKMSRDSSPARASDTATPNKNGSPLPALPSSWTSSRDSTRSLKDALAAALAKPSMTKPKQTVGGKPQTTASKQAPQAPQLEKTQPEKNASTWKDTTQKEMMMMNEILQQTADPKETQMKEEQGRSPKAVPSVDSVSLASLTQSQLKNLKKQFGRSTGQYVDSRKNPDGKGTRKARKDAPPAEVAVQIAADPSSRDAWLIKWVENGCSWLNMSVEESFEETHNNTTRMKHGWLTEAQITDIYKSEVVSRFMVAKKRRLGQMRCHPEIPDCLEAMQYLCMMEDGQIDSLTKEHKQLFKADADLDNDQASHLAPLLAGRFRPTAAIGDRQPVQGRQPLPLTDVARPPSMITLADAAQPQPLMARPCAATEVQPARPCAQPPQEVQPARPCAAKGDAEAEMAEAESAKQTEEEEAEA